MNIEKVNTEGIDGSIVDVGHFQTSTTAVLQLGNLEIETGSQYTLHGYAKASKSATMSCDEKSATIGTAWTEFAFAITADSKNIHVTFTPAEWWIYNWKLEKGSIMTPWTPSPIDAKEDIEQSTSEWKQTAEAIKSSVSKVSGDLTEAQSAWKQEAESISSSVSKVSGDLSTAETKWTQTASELSTEISKKTDSETVQTLITASADDIRLKTGKLVWEAENSSMTEDGVLTCKDGNFTGDINANSMTLGDGDQCKLLWGEAVPSYKVGIMATLGYYGGAGVASHSLDIATEGIALGSIILSEDGSTVESEAIIGTDGSETAVIKGSNGIYLNGTNWDDHLSSFNDLKTKHGKYDWSTFNTENKSDTWMPVMSGSNVYHRVVAATFSQANWWNSGNLRWTCLKLSSNIVAYFLRGYGTYSINKSAAKGYNSGEHTATLPGTIGNVLYANATVENNNQWENVELKIHSISSTQIKTHFWCQNSYTNLTLYYYLMVVASV